MKAKKQPRRPSPAAIRAVMAWMGSSRSLAKRRASANNGRAGGRPRKK